MLSLIITIIITAGELLTARSGDDMVLHSSQRSSESSWPRSVQPATQNIRRDAIPVNSCTTGVVTALRATFFDSRRRSWHTVEIVRVVSACPRRWTS